MLAAARHGSRKRTLAVHAIDALSPIRLGPEPTLRKENWNIVIAASQPRPRSQGSPPTLHDAQELRRTRPAFSAQLFPRVLVRAVRDALINPRVLLRVLNLSSHRLLPTGIPRHARPRLARHGQQTKRRQTYKPSFHVGRGAP